MLKHKANIKKAGDVIEIFSPQTILEQIPAKERWLFQSRIANARKRSEFLKLFNEFGFLHYIELPLSQQQINYAQHDQTFRDLVREKVIINGKLFTSENCNSTHPQRFQHEFLKVIVNAISHQCDSHWLAEKLAIHICGHLSRTRSGGDTYFAIKSLFDSPQLVITAFHLHSHPPINLHITKEGWAIISTSSTFNLFLHDDVHSHHHHGERKHMESSEYSKTEATETDADVGDGDDQEEDGNWHHLPIFDERPVPLIVITAEILEYLPISSEAQKQAKSNKIHAIESLQADYQEDKEALPCGTKVMKGSLTNLLTKCGLGRLVGSTQEIFPTVHGRFLRLSCLNPMQLQLNENEEKDQSRNKDWKSINPSDQGSDNSVMEGLQCCTGGDEDITDTIANAQQVLINTSSSSTRRRHDDVNSITPLNEVMPQPTELRNRKPSSNGTTISRHTDSIGISTGAVKREKRKDDE